MFATQKARAHVVARASDDSLFPLVVEVLSVDLSVAEVVAFDQKAVASAVEFLQEGFVRFFGFRAKPVRALAHDAAFHLRHARCRRALARGEGKDVQ